MDSAKGVPIEVWFIGALAIVGIVIFATQSSSGFTYLPGETSTAAAIIAQNENQQQLTAQLQTTGATLAVGYQTELARERATLQLATLASQSEYQLAQLSASSNFSLATLASTTSRAEVGQELNTALQESKIAAGTAKNNAFWGFLGSLASGITSLFTPVPAPALAPGA